jgi:hypothetical protein
MVEKEAVIQAQLMDRQHLHTIAQDLESDFISRIDLTFMWNEVNDKLRGSSYNVSVELYPSVIDCKPLYVAPDLSSIEEYSWRS